MTRRSPTAELRARMRDARMVHRFAAIEERQAAALAHLDAAMIAAGADALTLPGYRVSRTPDGIAVEKQPPTHADQISLWENAA
jgi:hypothetical protein